jgi:uncharacterized protein YggE
MQISARVVAAGLLFLFLPLSLLAQNPPPKPSISVSGSAEIRVPPDEVNLRLGVESRDVKLDVAVSQNDERLKAVLKFLKESGIEARDVQTDYVQIHPQFNPDRRVQQLTPEFYLVQRTIGVRLRKVAQFDTVLQGVLKTGANYVHGIEFRTTELRKHRDSARQQAIKAAKEKAIALATELGAKVGKPQNIHEQTFGGSWGWSGSSWGGPGGGYGGNSIQNVSQNAIAVPEAADADSNLSVGQISVTATVNVTFELE